MEKFIFIIEPRNSEEKMREIVMMIVFLYQQNRFRITINLNERIVENEGIFLHYGGDGSDDDDDDDDGIKNNQHEPKGNHVAENKDSYNLICKQM